MKSPLLLLVWAATVAVAFLLGGQLKPDAAARDSSRPAADDRPATLPAPDAPSPTPAEPRTKTEADGAAAPAPAASDAPPTRVEPVTLRLPWAPPLETWRRPVDWLA